MHRIAFDSECGPFVPPPVARRLLRECGSDIARTGLLVLLPRFLSCGQRPLEPGLARLSHWVRSIKCFAGKPPKECDKRFPEAQAPGCSSLLS